MCVCVCVHATSPPLDGCNTMSSFKRSKAILNLEFSFSYTGFLTKDSLQLAHISGGGEQIDSCFSKLKWSRLFEIVSLIRFPATTLCLCVCIPYADLLEIS